MYSMNLSRTGYNAAFNAINPTNASDLKVDWMDPTGSAIFSQPIEAGGQVYWGTFAGNEYAANIQTGAVDWTTFVGTTTPPTDCDMGTLGVVGTSEYVNMTVGGVTTPVLFVPGGNSTVYALNATTGAIIWKTAVGSSAWSFLWDSAVVYDGSLYIGTASTANCPVTIQGQLFKLNATTGAIEDTFDAVPNGCIGGGIWGSVTVDTSAGTLYVGTGSPDAAGCPSSEPLAPDLLELNASNLSLIGEWQVPKADQIADSDFGATPTLFEANGTPMVGIVNKNGVYYAFDRGNLDAGPVWSTRVSYERSVQPLGVAAYDGSDLYVSGGEVVIDGVTCLKSMWKLNPANGAVVWNRCELDGGLGAVSMVPGVVLEGTSYQVSLYSAATGALLYEYTDSNPNSSFWGSGSFSDGQIFFGNKDGNMYALGVGTSPSARKAPK